MIVMKFGGTSVADRAAIERLIAIVRAARQVAIQPESTDWRDRNSAGSVWRISADISTAGVGVQSIQARAS